METSVPWIFWLFPVVFAIHNLEEAVYLPHWSKSAGKFHKPIGAFEFRFAVIVLTAMSVVITIVFYMTGKQSIASYLFFAFNFGMLLNVFFPHLAATIVLWRSKMGDNNSLLKPYQETTGALLFFELINYATLAPSGHNTQPWRFSICEKAIRSSSALMVFIAQTNDKITWVKVGQSFERVALTATSLNIRMAHLNMPCEVVSVRAKLAEHLRLPDTHPLLLLRIGYAQVMPRSPLRAVKEMIIS